MEGILCAKIHQFTTGKGCFSTFCPTGVDLWPIFVVSNAATHNIIHTQNSDSMTTQQQIIEAKAPLQIAVQMKIAEKKRLFPNPDIETPLRGYEKQLTEEITKLFSQINTLNVELRKIRKAQ
jgi:hypothetical protein